MKNSPIKLVFLLMGVALTTLGFIASMLYIFGVARSESISIQIQIYTLSGITILLINARLAEIEAKVDKKNKDK